MICERCRNEIDPGISTCPSCGVRVSASAAGDVASDWRERVRETVARHQQKKQKELSTRNDEARQLSIFPEGSFESENEADRLARERRASIRARVEERLSKRHGSDPLGRVVDVGEVPLGQAGFQAPATRGAAAAVARKLDAPDPAWIDPRGAKYSAIPEPREPLLESDASEEEAASDALVGFSLATPFDRIFSGLIDLAFVSLIQLTLFYLTTHLVAQRLGALPQSALVAMGLVGAVLAAGYFLFFWSLSGQTLGKLLTGSRVVDRKGRALGFGRAAFRLLATLLALLPLGAGLLPLWTDPERRGWHDRIAGSKVIRG
jgi:uncharacterized RDD family membrane protein YckC